MKILTNLDIETKLFSVQQQQHDKNRLEIKKKKKNLSLLWCYYDTIFNLQHLYF